MESESLELHQGGREWQPQNVGHNQPGLLLLGLQLHVFWSGGPARARPTGGRRRGTGPSGAHCEVHGGQGNVKMHASSPREPRVSRPVA